jgi:hypothetical protein
LGVKSRDYISTRSILSEDFKDIPRKAGSEIYSYKQYNQAYQKTKNDINFPTKIMVHRVNTIEKLNFLKSDYKAFEVDVVFNNGLFDVFHPPASSINLSFEKYLKEDSKNGFYFWLDCKNLNKENSKLILDHLHKLDKKYDIKDRLIFESTNPESLKLIADAGFKTSWYLPPYSGSKDWEEIKYVTSLMPRLSPSFSAVSQGNSVVPALKRLLPGIDILTWGASRRNRKERKKLELLTSESSVKIVLIKVETKYDR